MMQNKILIWIMIILYLTNAMQKQSNHQSNRIKHLDTDPEEMEEFLTMSSLLEKAIEATKKTENLIDKNKTVYRLSIDNKKGANQDYAVKKIERMGNLEEEDKKFLNEVSIMQKLNHDNILQLIYHGGNSHEHYMITKECKGKKLSDRLNEGPFAEETAKIYLHQILFGVLHMRNNGIVHRDLNPGNIFTNEEKESASIKIIDFRLAFDCKTQDKTQIENSGSFEYSAPESSEKENGTICKEKQIEVWSLGVMLYQMLSGKRPYTINRKESSAKAVEKYYTFNFSDPIWIDISDEAKDLVTQMLTFNFEERINLFEIMDHPWWAHTEREYAFNIDLGNEDLWINEININWKTMRMNKEIFLKSSGITIRHGWKIKYFRKTADDEKVKLTRTNIRQYAIAKGIFIFHENKFEPGNIVEAIINFKTDRDQYLKGETFTVTKFEDEKVQMENVINVSFPIDYQYLPNFKIHNSKQINPRIRFNRLLGVKLNNPHQEISKIEETNAEKLDDTDWDSILESDAPEFDFNRKARETEIHDTNLKRNKNLLRTTAEMLDTKKQIDKEMTTTNEMHI